MNKLKEKTNPFEHKGSLIWWIEIISSQQNYLQAIILGYDGLAYYQGINKNYRTTADGIIYSLGRLTSMPENKNKCKNLLLSLGKEMPLNIVPNSPNISCDFQP